MLLQNKTAVVTGCNKCIGKKILEVFSANGATVIACVRNISEEFKDIEDLAIIIDPKNGKKLLNDSSDCNFTGGVPVEDAGVFLLIWLGEG